VEASDVFGSQTPSTVDIGVATHEKNAVTASAFVHAVTYCRGVPVAGDQGFTDRNSDEVFTSFSSIEAA